MTRIGGAVWLTGVVAMGFACRQGEPTSDPKTPPNSPFPQIEGKDDEPKATPPPPTLNLGDAG